MNADQQKQIREDIAVILKDNLHFAPQVDGWVAHGAIEKIMEYFNALPLPAPADVAQKIADVMVYGKAGSAPADSQGDKVELSLEGSKASDVTDESLFIGEDWDKKYKEFMRVTPFPTTTEQHIAWVEENILLPLKSQIAAYRTITRKLIERRDELIAKAQEQPVDAEGWIAVDKEKPKDFEEVLVWKEYFQTQPVIAYYDSKRNVWFGGAETRDCMKDGFVRDAQLQETPTHWRKLPSAPKT